MVRQGKSGGNRSDGITGKKGNVKKVKNDNDQLGKGKGRGGNILG